MKANPSDFELLAPGSLAGVLPLLGEYTPLAGGTELMVQFGSGHLSGRQFVSIWNLPELRQISVLSGEIRIGAGSTFTDIRSHPVLQREFPLLGQAAGLVGSIANQNRATLGGNLVNASPAADSSPPLLVYEAILEIVSVNRVYTLPYSEFHLGYKQTALKKGELVKGVILRRGRTGFQLFKKVGARNAQAISKIVFAGLGNLTDGKISLVRIALGSVSFAPIRCSATEALLKGRVIDAALIEEARAMLAKEITPIDDIRSTASYREIVAGNILEEFLRGLKGLA